jgi:hypothetical protein
LARKLLWLAFAAVFGSGVAAGAIAYRQAWPTISWAIASTRDDAVTVPTNERFTHRTSLFRTFPVKADVVMAGDSITEMADWPSIFPGVSILNRGIGFDNTAGLLSRLDTINSAEPKAVFLMAGTNDYRETVDVEGVFGRYEQIVAGIEPPAKVVVQSTLFVGDQLADRNPLIRDLNQRLMSLCGTGACTYVDLNSTLAPEGKLAPEFSIDGVHLNGEGYAVWKAEIEPLMPD